MIECEGCGGEIEDGVCENATGECPPCDYGSPPPPPAPVVDVGMYEVVPVSPPVKHRLPLITTSSQKAWSCARKYGYRHVHQKRPRGKVDPPLWFGTAWHLLMDAWWRHRGAERLRNALLVLQVMEADQFLRVTLRELLRGYHYRWLDETERLTVLSVERTFVAPLRNPKTGAKSRTFELAGVVDAEVRDDSDGRRLIVEHKTTSDDISIGSNYWQDLDMDVQISNYFNGLKEVGDAAQAVLYDVVKKPTIKPALATPPDKRKFKKDGTLYASQRASDERPEAWGARLRESMAENPEAYFRRGEIVRLESESAEAAQDLWLTAGTIREAYKLGAFPRNTARCRDWHRRCAFFDVCTGVVSIDDPERFEDTPPHTELSVYLETKTNNQDTNDDSNEPATEWDQRLGA